MDEHSFDETNCEDAVPSPRVANLLAGDLPDGAENLPDEDPPKPVDATHNCPDVAPEEVSTSENSVADRTTEMEPT